MIKSSQCAVAKNCQRQQINIRDLTVAHYSTPVDFLVVSQHDIARPKFTVRVLTQLDKLRAHCFKTCWAIGAVAWQIQNPQHTVSGQRARGNF